MDDTGLSVELSVEHLKQLAADGQPGDATFSATAFCPVCCSTVDVVGEGTHLLTCARCGQVWTMIATAARFERFSAL